MILFNKLAELAKLRAHEECHNLILETVLLVI